jgi:diguanylate cyclase (GGDEF)-like protein
MDGLVLCKLLRVSEWGQNIYIIMLTGADQEAELVEAFGAGLDDFLNKPVNMVALRARLKAAWRFVRLREAWEQDHERLSKLAAELALSNRRLQHASMTDPLTDLSNRRAGLVALSQAWSASVRHAQPLTLISLDIDHFKSINDIHGHPAGDAVLQDLGRNLRKMSRQEDAVCRWGGEEFLIISPNVDGAHGVLAAQRLRKHIAATPIVFGDKSLQVTASFGVASWRPDMNSAELLLKYADEALYYAKETGRNRVSEWCPIPDSK